MRTRTDDRLYLPLYEPDIILAYRTQIVVVGLVCLLIVGLIYIIAYRAAKRPE